MLQLPVPSKRIFGTMESPQTLRARALQLDQQAEDCSDGTGLSFLEAELRVILALRAEAEALRARASELEIHTM